MIYLTTPPAAVAAVSLAKAVPSTSRKATVADQEEMPTNPASPPEIQRLILVVEDTDELRLLVTATLQRHGFSVLETNSGESALKVAASHAIDGVLTDVEMPGINGIELCQKLTQLDLALGRRVPVWIMTGSDVPDSRARSAGAKGVFRKPFDAASAAEVFKKEFRASLEGVVTGGSATGPWSNQPAGEAEEEGTPQALSFTRH